MHELVTQSIFDMAVLIFALVKDEFFKRQNQSVVIWTFQLIHMTSVLL